MTNCMVMEIIDNPKYEHIFENQGVTWGIYKDGELKYIYCEIEEYIGERDIQYLYAIIDLNDFVKIKLVDPLKNDNIVYKTWYVSPYRYDWYNSMEDFIKRETFNAYSFWTELK